MTNEKSSLMQGVGAYLLALFFSFVFSGIFKRFYISMFQPKVVGSVFSLWGADQELWFNGFLLAWSFFLSFMLYFFLSRKRKTFLIVGYLLPTILFLQSGLNQLLWFIIISILGGSAGWGLQEIRLSYKRRNS